MLGKPLDRAHAVGFEPRNPLHHSLGFRGRQEELGLALRAPCAHPISRSCPIAMGAQRCMYRDMNILCTCWSDAFSFARFSKSSKAFILAGTNRRGRGPGD